MHCELFCRVVDNYGDAGFCWRLARQLEREHGVTVRLWIDAPEVLAHLWPAIDTTRARQRCENIDIHRWPSDLAPVTPYPVVIEAYGCSLPESFVAAMAALPRPPVWINLEYLSAEAWVEGCHALPSPHPRLPLTKHFFFPGFTAATGGLPRETDLSARRESFRTEPDAAARWLAGIGVEAGARAAAPLVVSLFCYDNPALPPLVAAWADGDRDVLCLVPQGAGASTLAALGLAAGPGATATRGRLRAQTIPFLDQDSYDRLLWSCDLNFVRGEDSFLRAQWAARPFVWQAYPQDDAVHHRKLDAFLARYLDGLAPTAAAAAARALFEAWNGKAALTDDWAAFAAALPALAAHAAEWDRRQAAQPDLAANLASFCRSQLK